MNRLNVRWVALFFATMLVVACGSNSPSGSVKYFYKNIEKGEITKAMEFFPQQIMVLGEPKIRKGLEKQTEQFSNMGGIQSIDAKDDCKGEVCFVDLKITFKNGKEMSERVQVTKENGKWKMATKSLF
jgi:Domain of unknown function (DUF4878)